MTSLKLLSLRTLPFLLLLFCGLLPDVAHLASIDVDPSSYYNDWWEEQVLDQDEGISNAGLMLRAASLAGSLPADFAPLLEQEEKRAQERSQRPMIHRRIAAAAAARARAEEQSGRPSQSWLSRLSSFFLVSLAPPSAPATSKSASRTAETRRMPPDEVEVQRLARRAALVKTRLSQMRVRLFEGNDLYIEEILALHTKLITRDFVLPRGAASEGSEEEESSRYRVVSDLEGNGDCFFVGLRQQLEHLRPWLGAVSVGGLRRVVADALVQNRHHLQAFVDEDYDRLVLKFRQNDNTAWGDNVAIALLAQLLNIRVVIFRLTNEEPVVIDRSSLSFSVDMHPQLIEAYRARKPSRFWSRRGSSSNDAHTATPPLVTLYFGQIYETHYVLVQPVTTSRVSRYMLPGMQETEDCRRKDSNGSGGTAVTCSSTRAETSGSTFSNRPESPPITPQSHSDEIDVSTVASAILRDVYSSVAAALNKNSAFAAADVSVPCERDHTAGESSPFSYCFV